MKKGTLAFILAGGKGERLRPLTNRDAKPFTRFGGKYRLVDFALTNLAHSGMNLIYVLTQFSPHGLHGHLDDAWKPRFGIGRDSFVKDLPASPDAYDQGSYTATAIAVKRHVDKITAHDPENVVILGADHAYLMDYRQMVDFHNDTGSVATVSALEIDDVNKARQLGVIEVDRSGKIMGFEEKPQDPKEIPGKPGKYFVSMGNYVFEPGKLVNSLESGTRDIGEELDFGKHIVPNLIKSGTPVFAYNFSDNTVNGSSDGNPNWWRDVGTLGVYHEAHMDLVSPVPGFSLYTDWRVISTGSEEPPVKISDTETMLCDGTILERGSNVRRSVLSYGVRAKERSNLEEVIAHDNVVIGPGSTIRKAILGEGLIIPGDLQIGVNLGEDRERARKELEKAQSEGRLPEYVVDKEMVAIGSNYKFQ